MDINKIAIEKYPDLDLRPFADKDGFIQNESPYWQMSEKRTAQRMAWIEGVKWCESQKPSTSESALSISDVVLSEAELLCSCGKPSDSPLCFDCFRKGLERDGAK